MSDSGASHMQTLEIEQRKLSRNLNDHKFSLGCPIQAHHISRRSKFNNGSSREIKMAISLHTEVRFRHITCRAAWNWISQERPLFNSEPLDILCARIGHSCEKLWPFEFLGNFRCSISSVSIYYKPESDIRVKSYDNLNFSRGSVF